MNKLAKYSRIKLEKTNNNKLDDWFIKQQLLFKYLLVFEIMSVVQ